MTQHAALLDLEAVERDEPVPWELVDRLEALIRRTEGVPHPIDAGASDVAVARALVELVPVALERHREAKVPADVTRETLVDVGRKHRLYGAAAIAPWMLELMRADVLSAGRLQVSMRESEHGHHLHVPELGPLLPAGVDASLACASELTGSGRFACTSWLLDPRLSSALAGSNIAAFAERFEIVSDEEETPLASEEAARFVFRRPLIEVIDPALPTKSRLERVVASTLRDGRNWTMPTGVLKVGSSR
ncbi:acyltransferase domain-containing protein [Microbacterium sp. NPDC060132]|uniref:acyltransferase domain-containing protein n=1 Tax=unclassified Microbacterium TaxID=2609290 RepID=UPI00109BB8C9|nr:acyltransferase domain-containing protein [Microbacterium sp. PF5]